MNRKFLCILVILSAALVDLRAAGDWIVLKNCHLIADRAK